jgi:hypothetical protein
MRSASHGSEPERMDSLPVGARSTPTARITAAGWLWICTGDMRITGDSARSITRYSVRERVQVVEFPHEVDLADGYAVLGFDERNHRDGTQ